MTMIWPRTALGLAALTFATVALAEAPVERPLWVWVDAADVAEISSHANAKALLNPDARVIWHLRFANEGPYRATTLDTDGNLIARFNLCEDCRQLVPDASGAAWAVQWRGSSYPSDWDPRWAIHRYATTGEVLHSIDFSSVENVMRVEILADETGSDIVLLPVSFEPGPGAGTLRVLRLDAAGNVITGGSYTLDHILGSVALTDWERMSDGSLNLVLNVEAGMVCLPLQPCPRGASVVLHLSPGRKELLRYEIEYPYGWYVDDGIDERLDTEGRVWRLFQDYGVGPSIELMEDGPGAVVPIQLAETPTYVEPLGYIGDAVLLDTYRGVQLSRFDGSLLAYRADAIEFEWWSLGADSDWGFLMQRALDEHHYDATLLHPQTLQDRVHFDLDGRQGTWEEVGLGGWSVLPDGWAYASAFIEEGGQTLQGVAAFAVPGSPAARPFVNGFE